MKAYRQGGFAQYEEGVGTLRASGGDYGGGTETLVIDETYQTVTGPLMANSHPGSYCGQDAYQDMMPVQRNVVRRLTPLECERLQGFPDHWTDIPGASDSARYKALGNSVAVPCISSLRRGSYRKSSPPPRHRRSGSGKVYFPASSHRYSGRSQ